ncbi:Copia protein, partial [Mucuna pruriens]
MILWKAILKAQETHSGPTSSPIVSIGEVEFRAIAYGICEGLSMKIILDNLKVKYEGPMKLFCENNSTISIAHNPILHNRTKHIEIERHFIKEKLDSGLIVLVHVPTGLQVIDVFTKGLPFANKKPLRVYTRRPKTLPLSQIVGKGIKDFDEFDTHVWVSPKDSYLLEQSNETKAPKIRSSDTKLEIKEIVY